VCVDGLKQSWEFFIIIICTNSANYGSFVRSLGAAEYRVGIGFFKCSEWGKVWYPVMLEPMPPQALNLVEMAMTESISRVIRILIILKMARYIKSAVLIVLFFRVQRRFNM